MSAQIHLEAVKGERYVVSCTHRTTSTGGGRRVDITGWTVRFYLRHALGDADVGSPAGALVEVDAVVATGTTGAYTIAFDVSLDVGVYVCDIWRTNAGFERQMAHGTFTVRQGVRTS